MLDPLAFSPDGQLFALGPHDTGTVELWETKTRKCVQRLAGQGRRFHSKTFSPDSQLLAWQADDDMANIHLGEIKTGRYLPTLHSHSLKSLVTSMAFSPDSQLLASGHYFGTIKLWTARTSRAQGQQEQVRKQECHPNMVKSIRYSLDKRMFQSRSFSFWEGWTVMIWDAKTGLLRNKKLNSLDGSSDGIAARVAQKVSRYVNSLKSSSSGLHSLRIKDQWILYGSKQILRLSPAYIASCWDTDGDDIAVGFEDGQVLCFTIDREMLSGR